MRGAACPPAHRQLRADYNLDKPLIVQYLLYMGNLVRGSGINFYGNKVIDELASRWPTTLKLGMSSSSRR
jgi:oligopeptide transport system permease protein